MADFEGFGVAADRWRWAADSIAQLFACGVFATPDAPLFRAAFVQLVIELNALLQAMGRSGARLRTAVVAEQDVVVEDITELVRVFRDALCYVPTPDGMARAAVGTWGFYVLASGRGGFMFAGAAMPVAPDGDTLVGIGDHRLLLAADLIPAVRHALAWVESVVLAV